MENVLKYYEFSEFFEDKSNAFSGNEICFTELNATHFLIFEKNKNTLNLYVSRFTQKNDIGVKPPEILELLVENYNKSLPAHRIAIRNYLG
ncbi:hypothetical protein MC378_07855 [Polaribacter sp. MSW13]|uniref:Uncharacterized protein n=1 Tax=Polaribacter marinus TaxID=2916838 RepID=A0A9X2AJI6_9FLAO|nr:hypothetical protein [Polaribacter marinus]MCI2229077.1 hypothetical protein [Polaribacter marinus]